MASAGYGPHERAGRGSGNSRNGAYHKTVVTEIGEVGLLIPRDRQDLSGKINGWKTILNTLTVHYGDRITASSIN